MCWILNQLHNNLSIYQLNFEIQPLKPGSRGLIRSLRHRGENRWTKGQIETRGKIRVSNTVHQRPSGANKRTEIGHWEADTVAGKPMKQA